ncbi:MAG: hypothetical protein WCH62_05230 [Candidatus Omnitrophota bacterium]
MRRIGLAASKIAKGNIWFYHLAVVLIASLFAIFLFLVCGFSIALTLFVFSLLAHQPVFVRIFKICLKFLGISIGIIAFIAVLKNIKFTSKT